MVEEVVNSRKDQQILRQLFLFEDDLLQLEVEVVGCAPVGTLEPSIKIHCFVPQGVFKEVLIFLVYLFEMFLAFVTGLFQFLFQGINAEGQVPLELIELHGPEVVLPVEFLPLKQGVFIQGVLELLQEDELVLDEVRLQRVVQVFLDEGHALAHFLEGSSQEVKFA